MNPDEKACPFCAETIKIAATVCRHCRSPLTAPRPQPRPVAIPARGGGFPTWAIVLIVFGALFVFGAIVAAIAIPGLLAARRAANERLASASTKIIATAESDYRTNDRDQNGINDFWVADVRGLYTGPENARRADDLKLIELSTALADSAPSPASRSIQEASISKSGYHFRMIVRDEEGADYAGGNHAVDDYHNNRAFGVCGYPSSFGSTGKITFIVNESYFQFMRRTAGPIESYPSERERAASWLKMD